MNNSHTSMTDSDFWWIKHTSTHVWFDVLDGRNLLKNYPFRGLVWCLKFWHKFRTSEKFNLVSQSNYFFLKSDFFIRSFFRLLTTKINSIIGIIDENLHPNLQIPEVNKINWINLNNCYYINWVLFYGIVALLHLK